MITKFKVYDDPSILMASKIVFKEGCRPLRIVLRKLGPGKYVTHEETLGIEVQDGMVATWTHEAFNHGNYHEAWIGGGVMEARDNRALEEARQDYIERAGRL